MKSRAQKTKQRVINSFKERARLNYNPGPLLREKFRRPTRKDRRHSGRKTLFIDGEYPYMETFWDDWVDWRDGLRDINRRYYWELTKEGKHGNILTWKMKKNKNVRKREERRKLMKLRNNPEFSPQTFFKN